MKKLLLTLLTFVFANSAFAQQPEVLFTGLTSTTPAPTNSRFALTDFQLFRQVRFQANQTVASGTVAWAFHLGTPNSLNYSNVWRPYSGGNTMSLNNFIPRHYGNGAKYNSGGGSDGLLPAITSGNYYTFNIFERGTADSEMAILETTYNPVSITSILDSPPLSASGVGEVTITTSAVPSVGEYFYLRYSSNGFATSSIIQINFSASSTTAKCALPCFTAGTVVNYYAFSSNKTLAQIQADYAFANISSPGPPLIIPSGDSAPYDLATLSLINGTGPNFDYTQPSNTTFSGNYSIPSSCYSTLDSFVTAINGGTVVGPVTVSILSSHTETAPVGGYNLTATGTAVNTITFQKYGATKPVFTAFTPQTAGNINDAVFKITGADYITLDGLEFKENASNTIGVVAAAVTTNNMTEFGVGLFYASVTNGAQNNTIKNCDISLNKIYPNTFGIYSTARSSATAVTGVAPATSADGANSFNKVYTNSISNVNTGIVFLGGTTAGFLDTNNDIGGTSAATKNTITNWGGQGTFSSYSTMTGNNYCIFVNHQINNNISYNTITSAAQNNLVTCGGILQNYSVIPPTGTVTTSITNNTIQLTNSPAAVGGSTIGINNQGITTFLSTATVNINNNIVQNCIHGGSIVTTGSMTGITNLSWAGVVNMTGNSVLNNSITATSITTGSYTAISNSGAAGTLNITSNTIRGFVNTTNTAITGSSLAISNSGAVTTAININNNIIGDATANACTYTLAAASSINNAIQNSGGATGCTLSISNNSFKGFSFVTAASVTAILNTSGFVGGAINIDNNNIGTADGNFVTYSGANSATLNGISNSGGSSASVLSISNNEIKGITHAVAASSLHQYIINSFATLSQNISSNKFNNLVVNTTGNTTFISNNVALPTGGSLTANSNSITTGYNKTGAGGTVTLFLTTNTPSSVTTVTKTERLNNFSNITLTGATTMAGWMDIEGAIAGLTKNISNNTFSNWSCGSGAINALQVGYCLSTASTINNNTISNISGSGAITGISMLSNNVGFTVDTNTINNLTSTSTTGIVMGISSAGGATQVITNNPISNLTTANNGAFRGIYLSTPGATLNTVTGNTITTMRNNSTGTSAEAKGIQIAGSNSVNVSGNTISDIATSTKNASSGSSIPIVGIHMASSGTAHKIDNNVIHTLAATDATAITVTVAGIITGTSTAGGTISKNKIYGLTNATSGALNFTAGLIPSGGNWTIANNMFSIINNNTVQACGVYDDGSAGTRNYHYNTINIGGTHGGAQVSAAFQFNAGTGFGNVRNNLINMKRTGGKNYTIANLGTSFTGLTLENNILNNLDATRVGIITGGVDKTFAEWQISSAQETKSYTKVPVFFTNEATADLHIDLTAMGLTTKTHLESGGVVVATTVDFDGDTRPSVAFTRGGGQFPDIGADEVDLTPTKCYGTNIWTGTVWSGKTANTVVPTLPVDASTVGKQVLGFDGAFSSTANVYGCNCTVTSGAAVINSGHVLSLTNEIVVTGGSITFENNSSLVQTNSFVDGTTIANTGNITYKRFANTVDSRDYVYWSSPVTSSQTLATIYPFSNNLYAWSAASGGVNGAVTGNWVAASGTMGLGAGYIIRNDAPGAYTTTFNGVPNNGTVTVTISRGGNTTPSTTGTNGATITNLDDNWNLIGNPYPSAVKATEFITANVANLSSGSIWLWTHNTPIALGGSQPFYNSFGYNYDPNDYIAYNQAGASSGAGTFSGNIAAGQSFFVNMIDGAAGTATVSFANTMRKDATTGVAYANANFYRTATQPIERNRIWLDLISSATNEVTRTLVGYVQGATQGNDFDFDTPANYESAQNIFSKIGNEIYTIQSKALPFDINDTIPMGIVVPTAGNYTIAIGEVDGLFANNGQTIYLEDTLLNTVNNLSLAPYNFASVSGINNRFVLRYTPSALSTNASDYLNNSVIVAKDKQVLKIKSTIENMTKVTIFDILGRKVFEKNDLNEKELITNNIVKNEQTLIVKITLENGAVVTKKVVY